MPSTPLSDHAAAVSTLAQMAMYAPPMALRLLLRSHHNPQAAVLPALHRWTRANKEGQDGKQRQQALEVIQLLHEAGADFNACFPGGQSIVARLRQSGFPEEVLTRLGVSPTPKRPSL